MIHFDQPYVAESEHSHQVVKNSHTDDNTDGVDLQATALESA